MRAAGLRRRHERPLSQSRRRDVRRRLGGIRHRQSARAVVYGVRRRATGGHRLVRNGRGGRGLRQRRLARHLRRLRHARRACSIETTTTARSARSRCPAGCALRRERRRAGRHGRRRRRLRRRRLARHRADQLLRAGDDPLPEQRRRRSTTRASGRASASTAKYVGFGVGFFDFDNDGWKDIFIANGHVYSQLAARKLHITYRQPKLLYRNLGNGRFEDVSATGRRRDPRPRTSAAAARSATSTTTATSTSLVNNLDGPPTLLRNDGGNGNNWILIKCVGTRSNRSAIGTRVKVTAGGRSQIDEVMSGSSYYSQNDLRLHFGLGDARPAVDSVELTWPSGARETSADLGPSTASSSRKAGASSGRDRRIGCVAMRRGRLLRGVGCALAIVVAAPPGTSGSPMSLRRRRRLRARELRPLRTSTCSRPWAAAWRCSTTTTTDGSTFLHERREARRSDAGGPAAGQVRREYWNRLYRQTPDGTFADVTEKAGLTGMPQNDYGMGVAVGDYDNDGFAGPVRHQLRRQHALSQQRRRHVHRRHGRAGVRRGGWSASAGFFDYDNDGRLDLFVTRYVEWTLRERIAIAARRSPATARTATRTTSRASRTSCSTTTATARSRTSRAKAGIADARRQGPGRRVRRLRRRRVHGRLRGQRLRAVVPVPQQRRRHVHRSRPRCRRRLQRGRARPSPAWAWTSPTTTTTAAPTSSSPTCRTSAITLFRQDGDGSFRDVTNPSGVGRATLPFSGWGTRFVDYDNDGWKDIFVAQGHVMDTIEKTSPNLRYLQPPLLLRNESRDGSPAWWPATPFEQEWAGHEARPSATSTTTATWTSSSATWASAPSCCATTAATRGTGWQSGTVGTVLEPRWPRLPREGRVRFRATQLLHASRPRSGYLSASDKRLLVGLGGDDTAELVEIRWPSGIVQKFENVEGRPGRLDGRRARAMITRRDAALLALLASAPAAIALRTGRLVARRQSAAARQAVGPAVPRPIHRRRGAGRPHAPGHLRRRRREELHPRDGGLRRGVPRLRQRRLAGLSSS